MMFNNKINKNGTIHFDVKEWICTDPDECQFCRKVSDTEFEYIQLKTDDLKSFVSAFQLGNKHLLSVLNDRTTIADWYQSETDVTDYDAEQIAEYLSPYGILYNVTDDEQTRNQLIVE